MIPDTYISLLICALQFQTKISSIIDYLKKTLKCHSINNGIPFDTHTTAGDILKQNRTTKMTNGSFG